ncbi:hypothetical protein BEP19_15825 [Ammoniphilus oxalaticus]|uniref:Phage portal protein n=1 Tax=Ammoniphilus oxalaticus TaxID=66863 RepID=A0A419SQA8_9BACL|nr:putative phage tail protein [Ammoniphilus oxalaticus]RKD26676.1 hypothetical protein BEP19_15825 [Ammoniphilus oxalaticus]
MSYGTGQYGTFLYSGQPGATSDDIQGYRPDLMSYLPRYYIKSNIMRAIQNANEEQLEKLNYAIDDLRRQMFVDTATWGLDLWEMEYGISTDRSRSYERRREVIKAKMRGAGTTTKEMVKSVAAAFSGGEVDVHEHPREYRFEIQFIGVRGIPPNMSGLIDAIDNIKPAHLAYSFKYTYTWWDKISELTWGDAQTMTWNDLRVYE